MELVLHVLHTWV